MQSGITSNQISSCYIDHGRSGSHNATKVVLHMDNDTKSSIYLCKSPKNSQPKLPTPRVDKYKGIMIYEPPKTRRLHVQAKGVMTQ